VTVGVGETLLGLWGNGFDRDCFKEHLEIHMNILMIVGYWLDLGSRCYQLNVKCPIQCKYYEMNSWIAGKLRIKSCCGRRGNNDMHVMSVQTSAPIISNSAATLLLVAFKSSRSR
jgi:hypothetical protein